MTFLPLPKIQPEQSRFHPSSLIPHPCFSYDRLASGYDGFMSPLERRFLARLRAKTLAALPENASILEIGAGTGLNFPYYPRETRGAVASELSSAMIDIARAKSRPQSVHLIQNSAEELPFADATFDAAFATLVFCSLQSPEKAFSEARRVVKPGGTIALLEHVRPEGLLGWFFDALSILTVALFDDHFNRRTLDEARRAGLHPVNIERRAFGIINIIVLKNSSQ
jgi:ubiquinone/menaquinone biosynthesis C-methylase UbiE